MTPSAIGEKGKRLGFLILEEILGTPGEQGEVWLGHLEGYEDVRYAVKISRKPVSGDQDQSFKAFEEEFRALASVAHPNIVSVHYVGVYDAHEQHYPYYIMEHLGEGAFTLKDVRANVERKLQLHVGLHALMQIASALHAVHAEGGRNHGDIKASNILVQYDPVRRNVTAKLIDFGFSRLLPNVEGPSRVADLAGRQPDQSSSLHRPRKAKSLPHLDVWALARTFYWLFAESGTDDSADLLKQHTTADWPIDYADFGRVLALLHEWSSVEHRCPAENADIHTFYDELRECNDHAQLIPLDPDVRGGLRYYAIDELATAVQIMRAFEAIRIPPRQLVLYTERVKQLISTPEFGALRYTRQLGFVHLVYPGANGTRFEHALGVYGLACRFVIRLAGHPAFRRICGNDKDVLKFLVLALLHDVGHYPYAHQLEEFTDSDFTREDWARVQELVEGHSTRGGAVIKGLAPTLRELFGFSKRDVDEVACAVGGGDEEKLQLPPSLRFLITLLDGTVDLDKLDYCERDAHHCGVPYGHYLDVDRILETARVLEASQGGPPVLGWHRRGLGCLEQVATARHQLYAYVYWHRAVRAATAMFKHAFYLLQRLCDQQELRSLFYSPGSDDCVIMQMSEFLEKQARKLRSGKQLTQRVRCAVAAIRTLLGAVSGRKRVLYKAVVDEDGTDAVRERCGGSSYGSQRRKAQAIYSQLRKASLLTAEAEELGQHNVLIDCRTDNVVKFEDITIVDDMGRVKDFGQCIPSIRGLGETFRQEACRVRVFVNSAALQPEYRAKEARGPASIVCRRALGLGLKA